MVLEGDGDVVLEGDGDVLQGRWQCAARKG